MEQLKSRIEAVLFTTAKALSAKEIGEILSVDTEVAEEAVFDVRTSEGTN